MNSKISNKIYLSLSFTLFVIYSCQSTNSNNNHNIAFYHWKANAKFSDKISETLTQNASDKIYMHYFDVDQINSSSYSDNGIYPTYVIKEIDSAFTNFNIVPVVYITNQVFKSKNLNVKELASQVKDLIHQISLTYFKKKLNTIQIDCDWTQSTRNGYFEFLTILKTDFEIDVTIRLHQVKFKEKTGIPPVNHGTLMLYNMGDLKNNNENSILESKIVRQYITESTNYPLNLHLGLPIFSQTILTNNDHEYKIIKNCERNLYENDIHFKKIDDYNFKVIKDTLYKGFYLTNGYNLKLEEIDPAEIEIANDIIKSSELNIDETIFYHLDEKTLSNIDLKKLINEL